MEANDANLLDLLQDISTCFDQMPPDELRAFTQHWHELLAYLNQNETNQTDLVARLQQTIAASPVLVRERYDKVLDIKRYTPNLNAMGPSAGHQGVAPIRNEVVRAVHQIGQQLQQHTSGASA